MARIPFPDTTKEGFPAKLLEEVKAEIEQDFKEAIEAGKQDDQPAPKPKRTRRTRKKEEPDGSTQS